jgi:ATP-dependent DNA helicase RecG
MSDEQRVRQLLRQGEGLTLEFKESRADLPRSLFETICAFLNREGGTVLLGVRDDGTVTGVDPDKVSKLIKELVTTANSPEKLSPICMLFPETIEVDGKTVLYVPVPPGSQVHRTKGHPYDRSADGDFRITDPESLRLMYLRKAAYFSENQVFPYLTLADFDAATLQRARQLAQAYRDKQHPWATISDEEMLRSAGLWQRDMQTGKEGYTLAAALLFGTPQTLLSTVPQYFVDALVRRVDEDRYDDRDYIRDNLLNTYDRLIDFVSKHLYDPFYLEGVQRISIRGVIFREVIVNLLAHREYSSGFTARMMIYRDRVVFENPNRAFYQGPIDPDTFTPRTKNPTLANFFKETGFMDQLGSGIREVTKYIGAYANGKAAQFIEGDMFRTIIPLDDRLMSTMVTPSMELASSDQKSKEPTAVLINVPINVLLSEPSRQRITGILTDIAQDKTLRSTQWAERYGVTEKTIRRDLELLRDANLIRFEGSKKSGRYVLTQTGKQQVMNK